MCRLRGRERRSWRLDHRSGGRGLWSLGGGVNSSRMDGCMYVYPCKDVRNGVGMSMYRTHRFDPSEKLCVHIMKSCGLPAPFLLPPHPAVVSQIAEAQLGGRRLFCRPRWSRVRPGRARGRAWCPVGCARWRAWRWWCGGWDGARGWWIVGRGGGGEGRWRGGDGAGCWRPFLGW